MREAHLKVVFSILCTTLGLHQKHTIDTLMTVKCYGSSVFQDGNTLHLFYGEAVDGSLYTIHQDEDTGFPWSVTPLTVSENLSAILISGLGSTDIERSTTSFLALETSILVGVQTKKLTIQGICQTDG